MLPVEIVPVDGTTLVLRARGSELLILPHHIGQLKSCKNPKDFTGYFLSNALLNRPARKLFEAWLRKDKSLWNRIYRTIQSEMDSAKIKEFEERMNAASDESDLGKGKVAAPKSKEAPAAKAKPAAEEKETKKKVAAPAKAKAKSEDEDDSKPAKKPAAGAAKKKDAKAEKPAKAEAKKASPAKKPAAAKTKKK